MPTGILNVVCDECYGGALVFLPTGERQLQHHDQCPYKYREDTFLISIAMETNCPMMPYPDVKLNPVAYDMFCNGYFTKSRNKVNGYLSQARANKVNKNLQLIREAMIQDGTWPMQEMKYV